MTASLKTHAMLFFPLLKGGNTIDVVVVLTELSKLDGDTLTYKYDVIEGQMPESGDANSLFINVIGRPRTPVSVAGVHRRHVRRSVRRCAAGITCY